ncbi:MAG: hypothetical protein P1U87_18250 [Verrucomicrobiales bacterium]|nr:hypothetical protein [Verrucomicrobiales bacterium]
MADSRRPSNKAFRETGGRSEYHLALHADSVWSIDTPCFPLNSPDPPSPRKEPPSPQPRLFRLGVFLILLSGVFFFLMLSIPFFRIGDGQKAWWGGGLFIGMQVAWWTGAACIGPAAVKKLGAWFKRSKK